MPYGMGGAGSYFVGCVAFTLPTYHTFLQCEEIDIMLQNTSSYSENTNAPAGYRIRLGSNTWCYAMADSVGLETWVGRFAEIMELNVCRVKNETKRIYFDNHDENNKPGHTDTREVPDNGWKCHDLNTLNIWYHDHIPDVICGVKTFDNPEAEILTMWNALYPIYRESITLGGLPFHAGLVERDGRGVILAGPGNRGKSTCCSRLPDSWVPLCDDETLVILDKVGNFRAHPFPTWSDHLWRESEKTWNVQYSVPISGVFFIEQSEVDEVIPLGEGESTSYICQSAMQVCRKYWKRADQGYQRTFRRNLFDNACEMAKKMPAFRIRVSLYGRFWEEIDRALSGGKGRTNAIPL